MYSHLIHHHNTASLPPKQLGSVGYCGGGVETSPYSPSSSEVSHSSALAECSPKGSQLQIGIIAVVAAALAAEGRRRIFSEDSREFFPGIEEGNLETPLEEVVQFGEWHCCCGFGGNFERVATAKRLLHFGGGRAIIRVAHQVFDYSQFNCWLSCTSNLK